MIRRHYYVRNSEMVYLRHVIQTHNRAPDIAQVGEVHIQEPDSNVRV